MDSRFRKAKGAFGILSPIWRNSSFPNSLKIRIFKGNVVSVLYQCYMVQALGMSPNQSPPNFKTFCTNAPEAFFTFIGQLLYLMWIYWKWRICSRLMWSLEDINGAGLGISCEKMSLKGPTSYATEYSGWHWENKGKTLRDVETNCGGQIHIYELCCWFPIALFPLKSYQIQLSYLNNCKSMKY